MKRFNYYWAGFAIFAFASVISFFQIDGYWADQHHLGNLLWIGLGILFAAISIYCIKKV
jgi:hypothetical protein